METKFNFESQICTTREQSERLLALGLKKETADMHYRYFGRDSKGEVKHYSEPSVGRPFSYDVPAWSLHRLIEMTPSDLRGYMCKNIFDEKYAIDEQFDELIATIGYYIKEGYFKKEYLENGNY